MAGLRDVGEFIREQRRSAQISLRQLAKQTGVSNPYLSQIERGLRKPSAEVLQQIATALRVSTPVMYLRAGLLEHGEGPGVLTAIAADEALTVRQKQSLAEIYEAFRRENLRNAPDAAESTASRPRRRKHTVDGSAGTGEDEAQDPGVGAAAGDDDGSSPAAETSSGRAAVRTATDAARRAASKAAQRAVDSAPGKAAQRAAGTAQRAAGKAAQRAAGTAAQRAADSAAGKAVRSAVGKRGRPADQ